MGREIRRVPPNWEHPKYTADNALRPESIGEYRPLFDNDYETAAEEWIRNLDLWRHGSHPDQPCPHSRYFWEWENPPDEDMYRARRWLAEEAAHYQVYETVSEGTPVTPAFATKEALINYLVEKGDTWGQGRTLGGWTREVAETFVRVEFAPSLIMVRSAKGMKLYQPRDGMPPTLKHVTEEPAVDPR